MRGGIFSVALSVGSPLPRVTRHTALWSSDFPRPLKEAATAWPTPDERYCITGLVGLVRRTRLICYNLRFEDERVSPQTSRCALGQTGSKKLVLQRAPLAGRLRSWMPALFLGLLCLYAFWPWLHGKPRSSRMILFYGYSIAADVMTQSVFPAFQKQWESTTGEHFCFYGAR